MTIVSKTIQWYFVGKKVEVKTIIVDHIIE